MVTKKARLDDLDKVVNVRVSRAEKEQIKFDAGLASMSVSAFCRARFLGIPIVAQSDEVMIRELRRLGGLLKHAHTESKGAYSRDTAKAISDLAAYVNELRARAP